MEWGEHYFDLAVSFQVIEHIPQALLASFLQGIQKVTKKGGVICLSTLNLEKNQKKGKPYQKSPHHDKEFTAEEFKRLLNPFFGRVDFTAFTPQESTLFLRNSKKPVFQNFYLDGPIRSAGIIRQ